MPAARVLIVLTARPEFQPPWRLGGSQATPLTLGRLPRSKTREMIEQVAGDQQLPSSLREQLATRSDGIPLFAEELALNALESASPSPAVPATLQDSLMGRLDRLGQAKAVAQLAATIGRQFSITLLCAVSPFAEETVQHELSRLVDADLLQRSDLDSPAMSSSTR
jgi:predicted ATPase